MKKIKALFVDDEYLALDILAGYVSMIDEIEVVAQVKDPLKAIIILNESQIDLLFLDIHMRALKGTDLLKTINPKPVTIFTTAFTDYATEAYDLNAVDYLIKPFSFERFLQAYSKAREVIRSRGTMKPFQIPQPTVIASDLNKFITIKNDKKLIKIHLRDILFIEGCREYVKIHTDKGMQLTLDRLKNIENMLPEDEFVRVHKSFIVSINRVTQLVGNELVIDKYKIPVSRDLKENVVKQIFGS